MIRSISYEKVNNFMLLNKTLIFTSLLLVCSVPPTPAREHIYYYDKAGNMPHSIFNNYDPDVERHTYYSYTGDQQTGSVSSGISRTATFDLNGRQTSLMSRNPSNYWLEYDWDGKLRRNRYGQSNLGLEAKYTPDGTRIWKKRNYNLTSYEHKYIVDMASDLPKILLVLDANDNNAILKTYIHAHNQVIAQHDGDYNASRYFYLHDRLGSVRQIINTSGTVENCYFYAPWGGCTGSETDENVDNWYGFAGYWSDDEAESYYCNARNYYRGRFTTRDPVRGSFKEPMSLHAYLYCLNDPVNRTDPTGEFLGLIGGQSIGANMRRMSLAMGSRAMAFAGRIYAAAYVRAVGINLFMYDLMYGGGNLTKVSRWGRPGLQSGDWIMKGGANWWNYLRSGKWQPGMGNQFAPFGSGQEFWINAEDVAWPAWYSWWKAIIFGQRIYDPK